MKRVLITGSAGFLGSHLVEHLLENTDWEIVGIDSFRHRGDSMRVVSDPRYKVFCHDLTAPISDRLASQILPLDYIVNMASMSHVDTSLIDPVGFFMNNVQLGANVLELARQEKPEKFIQISTDEVYGPAPSGTSHKEWSVIAPSNPYAASKAAQEALAFSYWRSFGVPLIITNTMNLFGERQDPEKFIPLLIQKVSKGEEVTVHGNTDVIGSRFYLHARNMADAILYLLENVKPIEYEDRGGSEPICLPSRYNIVGEMEVSNLDMAKSIAHIVGEQLKFRFEDFHKTRPGHDRRYALDGTKLFEAGWIAPVNFYSSIRQTVEWTLKNKEWLR